MLLGRSVVRQCLEKLTGPPANAGNFIKQIHNRIQTLLKKIEIISLLSNQTVSWLAERARGKWKQRLKMKMVLIIELLGRARLEGPCTGKSRQTLAESANKHIPGRSVTAVTVVPSATDTQVGFWVWGIPLFVLVNGLDRSVDFMCSDKVLSASQVSCKWGGIHLSLPQSLLC